MNTYDYRYFFKERIEKSVRTISSLLEMKDVFAGTVNALSDIWSKGGKWLICGNGGSAADSMHLAAECVGGMGEVSDMRAGPAISLTSDNCIITALANDFGYEEVFARQILVMAVRGDALLAFSTSGRSKNVIRAIEQSRELGVLTVGFTGGRENPMSALCDHLFRVDSTDTAYIQESHVVLYHSLILACGKAFYLSGRNDG